ncbi:MAG: hypothetical protein OXN81_20110, partial [Alphaproteobacteria bacterium]|nr:hypothetical protein [Alphaproteobacteria bacterium]
MPASEGLVSPHDARTKCMEAGASLVTIKAKADVAAFRLVNEQLRRSPRTSFLSLFVVVGDETGFLSDRLYRLQSRTDIFRISGARPDIPRYGRPHGA